MSVKNGHLFYDGRPVAAVQLNVAIGMFLDWLQSLKQPCLLFAHNAKLFDAKHLQRALEKSNQISRFQEFVPGFCDTLPAFKEVLPNRKSYSQENLAKDLLQATYSAHNALSDVRMLQELCNNFLRDGFENLKLEIRTIECGQLKIKKLVSPLKLSLLLTLLGTVQSISGDIFTLVQYKMFLVHDLSSPRTQKEELEAKIITLLIIMARIHFVNYPVFRLNLTQIITCSGIYFIVT